MRLAHLAALAADGLYELRLRVEVGDERHHI
jgi:hypothetical protein